MSESVIAKDNHIRHFLLSNYETSLDPTPKKWRAKICTVHLYDSKHLCVSYQTGRALLRLAKETPCNVLYLHCYGSQAATFRNQKVIKADDSEELVHHLFFNHQLRMKLLFVEDIAILDDRALENKNILCNWIGGRYSFFDHFYETADIPS